MSSGTITVRRPRGWWLAARFESQSLLGEGAPLSKASIRRLRPCGTPSSTREHSGRWRTGTWWATLASVRLRTSAAKRFKRVESATALIWKLLTVAEKRFRKLTAPRLLGDVFEGRKFKGGKPVATPQRDAAA